MGKVYRDGWWVANLAIYLDDKIKINFSFFPEFGLTVTKSESH